MDLVLTLQPHTANYHECCRSGPQRLRQCSRSQRHWAHLSHVFTAMPVSRQLRKLWIFFLRILSSSPFLECTVGVDFRGAVLKTCARSEGKHAKGPKRQCVWLAYWVPWSFWECCTWCLHFECILSRMEVTQQNRVSVDCSGEGTEMCASLLIGLRNVGTQRTQHPGNLCSHMHLSECYLAESLRIYHFLLSKMLAFYICDRFHMEIKFEILQMTCFFFGGLSETTVSVGYWWSVPCWWNDSCLEFGKRYESGRS